MQNAMIIDPKDNVAVAIEPIAAGDTVTYLKEGKTVSLKATEDITIYHKLATRTIEKGEHIGVATEQIPEGAHVHVHNVESMKEDRRGME